MKLFTYELTKTITVEVDALVPEAAEAAIARASAAGEHDALFAAQPSRLRMVAGADCYFCTPCQEERAATAEGNCTVCGGFLTAPPA